MSQPSPTTRNLLVPGALVPRSTVVPTALERVKPPLSKYNSKGSSNVPSVLHPSALKNRRPQQNFYSGWKTLSPGEIPIEVQSRRPRLKPNDASQVNLPLGQTHPAYLTILPRHPHFVEIPSYPHATTVLIPNIPLGRKAGPLFLQRKWPLNRTKPFNR